MGHSNVRRRVYIKLKRGEIAIRKIVDLSFIGEQPIAVLSWVKVGKELKPEHYVVLDALRLTRSAPAGMWWYDVVVPDPRVTK